MIDSNRDAALFCLFLHPDAAPMKALLWSALILLVSAPTFASERWLGGVTARVQIDADGNATSIEFDRARSRDLTEEFKAAMMERLRRVEFEPARLDGQPAASETSLHVSLGVVEGPEGFGPLRIEGLYLIPGYRKVSPPQYPRRKLMRGIEGYVEVKLSYDAEGRVTEARIFDAEKADPDFAKAALAAARKWQFDPQKIEGRGVPGQASVPVFFAIPGGPSRGESEVAVLRLGDGSRLQVVKDVPEEGASEREELADSVVGIRSIDKAREAIGG
jgi:TonB family protein